MKYHILHDFRTSTLFNPISPGLFSRTPDPGGLRVPDAKNHSYHKPIEIKFCGTNYRYNNISDAKVDTVVSLYATVSKLNAASLTGVQQQQHLI